MVRYHYIFIYSYINDRFIKNRVILRLLEVLKMKLVKSKCKKQGFEKYWDLCLIFIKDGKEHKIPVRPVSYYSRDLLVSVAKEI